MTETTARLGEALRTHRGLESLRRYTHGLALSTVVAVAATAAALWIPLVGAPVLAILLGAGARLLRKPHERALPGVAFASKRILQAAVVLLGAGISLTEIVHTGLGSLPVMLATLAIALLAAAIVGRAMGVEPNLRTLIGIGTGICGASAIAAASSVIDAKRSEIAYAMATIFAFNVVGVVSFPLIGHALGLGQQSFGLWAGTAINDTSSVVAAAAAYGHAATDHAVVVKLTRTTLIVPIVLVLGLLHARRAHPGSSVRPRTTLPWFIAWFVVAAAFDTAGVVGHAAHRILAHLAVFLITVALAAIGLSADARMFRRAGLRPLALGAIVWFLVGGTSLFVQALTGQM